MDIKGLNSNNLRPDSQSSAVKGREQTERASSQPQGTGNAPVAGDDSVTLTGAAQAMNAAGNNASAPFDAARVAELREAIANGNYPIDNKQLADRMIDLERMLR
ncbi:flagellar biosynthesis anti-sigma factor FlgM [Thioalkalivibrio sp. ALJ16]|uniref:flagellar biosynthesis anti-sigma factor FlgM n=1 Tax=Thioalkalivibrio sp. ALJ16 TaxID=1158762 RepID=UPI00037DB141|nr:flagellar biosynthesis anti-sigma factor FlgM [Thioalkalivibrio sp. ALJ16]